MRSKAIYLLILILVVILLAWYLNNWDESKGGQDIISHSPIPEASNENLRVFSSDSLGINFSYPDSYFIVQKDTGSSDKPQQSIIIFEDTVENREIIEGKTTLAREGPTTITIDVHENSANLSPAEWIESETNWVMLDKSFEEKMINDLEGLAYNWSGLYEGKSIVVANGKRVYVISVTWLTTQDQILRDFEIVTGSIRFN